MNKIPVGKTITYAYSFTFGHLGTIIGLVWLPLVIMTVLGFLPRLAGSGLDSADQSPLAVGSQAIGGVAVIALTFLLYAIICVAVTRQALGLRQGVASVHFALGMGEFRMFGALLLMFGVMVAFLITYLFVIAIADSVGGNSAAAAIAASVIAMLGALALIYAVIRLVFLVVPVTVAEEQINLVRGWSLTQSNFWRILAVMLAVGLPIFLVYAIGNLVIMGSDTAANVPAAIANNFTELLKYEMRIVDRHLPGLLFLELILAPFSFGLNLGAAAFAYRALVQDTAVVRAA
ncbi:MAG: hypothetical protein ABSA49_01535 [Rhizomicrobium sp.]|jgi:hypothetical protein